MPRGRLETRNERSDREPQSLLDVSREPVVPCNVTIPFEVGAWVGVARTASRARHCAKTRIEVESANFKKMLLSPRTHSTRDDRRRTEPLRGVRAHEPSTAEDYARDSQRSTVALADRGH